jgi:hypothetical protein
MGGLRSSFGGYQGMGGLDSFDDDETDDSDHRRPLGGTGVMRGMGGMPARGYGRPSPFRQQSFSDPMRGFAETIYSDDSYNPCADIDYENDRADAGDWEAPNVDDWGSFDRGWDQRPLTAENLSQVPQGVFF